MINSDEDDEDAKYHVAAEPGPVEPLIASSSKQRLVVPPPNVDSEWPVHRKSFLAFEGYYGAFFLL